MLIHGFLYDPTFVNTATIFDPIFKVGGTCVLSQRALSYFVSPQEIEDPRTARATNLTTIMSGQPRLVIDQTLFATFLTDVSTTWTGSDRQALFAIIDQLCFAYSAHASTQQVELALSAWTQYLPNSFVYSTTTSSAMAYKSPSAETLTCPDYVSFTFVASTTTQYELRIWLSNSLFITSYPLSTIRSVIPPLPLSELYTVNLNTTANIYQTALQSAGEGQQDLQNALQSGLYTGYASHLVTFMDGNGNTAPVQFNLLYNGATPGSIAIRTAIRTLLNNSGVGTSTGWRALAPSLFVTELFYLVPLWDHTTSLILNTIYPNIVALQSAITDVTTVFSDIPSGYITANVNIMTVPYDNLTVLAIPDTENDNARVSLAFEHPTYQDVPTTDAAFSTMTTLTQQFATLLIDALSVAYGNASTNTGLVTYTPPNDNRTYVTFNVGDVAYYVITKTSYLARLNPS